MPPLRAPLHQHEHPHQHLPQAAVLIPFHAVWGRGSRAVGISVIKIEEAATHAHTHARRGAFDPNQIYS